MDGAPKGRPQRRRFCHVLRLERSERPRLGRVVRGLLRLDRCLGLRSAHVWRGAAMRGLEAHAHVGVGAGCVQPRKQRRWADQQQRPLRARARRRLLVAVLGRRRRALVHRRPRHARKEAIRALARRRLRPGRERLPVAQRPARALPVGRGARAGDGRGHAHQPSARLLDRPRLRHDHEDVDVGRRHARSDAVPDAVGRPRAEHERRLLGRGHSPRQHEQHPGAARATSPTRPRRTPTSANTPTEATPVPSSPTSAPRGGRPASPARSCRR